jgi:hypothetical protein
MVSIPKYQKPDKSRPPFKINLNAAELRQKQTAHGYLWTAPDIAGAVLLKGRKNPNGRRKTWRLLMRLDVTSNYFLVYLRYLLRVASATRPVPTRRRLVGS